MDSSKVSDRQDGLNKKQRRIPRSGDRCVNEQLPNAMVFAVRTWLPSHYFDPIKSWPPPVKIS